MSRKSKTYFFGMTFVHLFLIILCILCLIPFLLVVSGSISNETDVLRNGFKLIPQRIDFSAYQYLLVDPSKIMNAYKVTIAITVLGTFFSLLIMVMVAYPLSRTNFKARKIIMFYLFFTSLFSGGLVPSYLLITKYLKLENTLWVMFVPSLVNVFYIIILRTFFQQIPVALVESAKIDGASENKILRSIILPMAKPAIATIVLFNVLGRWNEWYSALLYITNDKLIPLQYLLQNIMARIQFMQLSPQAAAVFSKKLPGETARMAMVVLTTGPIVMIFPFFQKYFQKGMTVGSLKG